MSTVLAWGALALCGGCGAVLRFVLDGAVTRRFTSTLPMGTMVVNATGALVLGVLNAAALPEHLALVFGTGLIGAYTTFSTWMFETQRLVEERQNVRAAQNIVLSLALGLAAGALGLWIGGYL
ncbi:MAG: fluoride efflux transporter CrcB [Nocardioides sp.]